MREAHRLASVVLLIGLASLTPWSASAETAEPGAAGPTDRCPVCGMLVAPHARWQAQVVFDDGSAAFFDGAKDMFRYLVARDRYLPEKRSQAIRATFVTTYYELEVIPADEALFVLGSEVLGPMGPELIPHRTREDADEFAADHRGHTVVRFEDVTLELLQSLGAGGGGHHGR